MMFLLACASIPDTAPEVLYDKVACTHCGMMVSDPNFAAEMVTKEGDVRVYDDPACLFRDMMDSHPAVARMWFRDSTTRDEKWIPWDAVGFVSATGAPMDGGWAAVPAGTPGAVTFGEASAKVMGGGR